MFNNFYYKKKVLITGHTGFKGSWLANWLVLLGADVIGISLDPHTEPSNFKVLDIAKKIKDYRIDILDFKNLNNLINESKPDIIFHLAAQAIVNKSFDDPIITWKTNLIGTINIMQVLRNLDNKCISVFITSDKCYKNNEWLWGYKETDELGGEDPYSASKSATEIAIKSYFKTYLKNKSNIKMASARAGNVIGGGDWSQYRLIPDCVIAWSKSNKVTIRSPKSTRPWQHVLEPLSGYLNLASNLDSNESLNGESFNFGPNQSSNKTVIELVKQMNKTWKNVGWTIDENKEKKGHEANLLSLNCDKALHYLNWSPTLNFQEMSELTIEWYKTYYENKMDINKLTIKQINLFSQKIK